ncbi:hypothetical protein [Paraburkholderia sp. MM5477-R1]|uniref:hypothetical protein n=1 Tax=Paraburkholderia sp. MM5477-R1 TaxID=2991062 RepID=UPI003D250C77
MKIKLIEDGNLTSWLRLLLIVIGTVFVVVAIECKLEIFWARVFLLLGFAIALIGGMTSRAKLLHIKPFDNSYKKARDSYKTKDDKNNE